MKSSLCTNIKRSPRYIKGNKQFAKCSNQCVEYAHKCIWEEQEKWIYVYVCICTHMHTYLLAYAQNISVKNKRKKHWLPLRRGTRWLSQT